MGERYSVYIPDDESELQEFIEEYGDIVGGESDLFKLGVRHLMNEKSEPLEKLKPDEGLRELT